MKLFFFCWLKKYHIRLIQSYVLVIRHCRIPTIICLFREPGKFSNSKNWCLMSWNFNTHPQKMWVGLFKIVIYLVSPIHSETFFITRAPTTGNEDFFRFGGCFTTKFRHSLHHNFLPLFLHSYHFRMYIMLQLRAADECYNPISWWRLQQYYRHELTIYGLYYLLVTNKRLPIESILNKNRIIIRGKKSPAIIVYYFPPS